MRAIKFYSIYEKFYKDLKAGDSTTVEKIGGTECQKCYSLTALIRDTGI